MEPLVKKFHAEDSCLFSRPTDECGEHAKSKKLAIHTSTGSVDNTSTCKKRKKPKSLHNQHSIMKQKAEEFQKNETEYYFENGFRKVFPYYFTFHTFCKGRWLGKTLHEIFTNEFRFHTIEHYERARKCGHLQVNMKPVESLQVKLKDNDLLSSKLHRHEAPVVDSEIKILHEDSHFLVVDKPSSIPIHPCGRYRNNTLCYILQKENGYTNLFGCHRLDRLTSGIVIFAKTKHFANKVITEIRERKVEKEYICKVVGEFPADLDGITCDEPVTVFDRKIGCCCAWKVDGFDSKDATTHFHRLSTDGDTSVLLCKPKTGRTHQIRVHLQFLGFPIVNDPMYNHEAWGDERFRYGPCTKNVTDVGLAISRTYENDAHVMLNNPVSSEQKGKIIPELSQQGSMNKSNIDSHKRETSFTGTKTLPNEVESSSNLVKLSSSYDETSSDHAETLPNKVHSSLIPDQALPRTVETSSNVIEAFPSEVEAFSSNGKTLPSEVESSPNHVRTLTSKVLTSSNHDETSPSEVKSDERFCPTCPECVNPLPDPDMRWMTMYLHAYSYKGSDWEFKTKIPSWAGMETLT